MLERFFPDEYISSTYAIPFDRLYEESFSILTIPSFPTGPQQTRGQSSSFAI